MSGIGVVVLVFFVLAGCLGGAAYLVYQRKLRRAKSIERGLKMVPLLIHLPPPSGDTAGGRDAREVMREKTAQAEALYNLIAGTATSGFKSSFYGQRHLALEIVAAEGVVHFYVAVPVNLVDVVRQAVLTSYPGARLEEVEDHNIFNKQGRLSATAGGDLVLKADGAYPIATYANLERDPLDGLITTLSGLTKTDGVAVQIMLRPARPAWVRHSTQLTLKLRRGRQHGMSIDARDLARAVVAAPNTAAAHDVPKGAASPNLTQLELSTIEQIEEKTKHPGFEVLIRLVVSADSAARSQQVLQSLATSFALFERPGLNGFKFLPAVDVQGLVTAFILRFFPPEMHSSVLNSQELATLFHLPDSQFTLASSVERQKSKEVDGPVSIPSTGLLFGYNEFRGVRKEIRMGEQDRRRHTYILGQTGTGKSTMLENLIVQDMLAGNGFAFIDPHGDAAEKVLSLVPKSRAEDVIYFNPGDTDFPLGLNLFEYDKPEQKDFIIQESLSMLYKLYDPNGTGVIGPRFEQWYRNAALTLMADPNGSTFIEIPKVFTDTEYLKGKFKYLKDPTVIEFWTKEMGQTSDYHKSEMLGYFVSKFGAFQQNEMMRNIIGQTKSAFKLRDIMDNKKILIVNLSKGRVGEMNAKLLGMMLVIKFQAAAMSRADMPEDERNDFCLYVDEFQNFSTDSFASILSEARKYRLNLIVGNQFIGQLSEEIREAVFGNIGTIVAHRMGPEDAEFMVKQFTPVFDTSDLMNLPNYHSATRFMIGGLPSQPFTMNDLPPVAGANAELGIAIKQLSAAKFGAARQVVEADILGRLEGKPVQAAPALAAAAQAEEAKDTAAETAGQDALAASSAGQPVAAVATPAAEAPVQAAETALGEAGAGATPAANNAAVASADNVLAAELATANDPAEPARDSLVSATGDALVAKDTPVALGSSLPLAAAPTTAPGYDVQAGGPRLADNLPPVVKPQVVDQPALQAMATDAPPIGAAPVDLAVMAAGSTDQARVMVAPDPIIPLEDETDDIFPGKTVMGQPLMPVHDTPVRPAAPVVAAPVVIAAEPVDQVAGAANGMSGTAAVALQPASEATTPAPQTLAAEPEVAATITSEPATSAAPAALVTAPPPIGAPPVDLPAGTPVPRRDTLSLGDITGGRAQVAQLQRPVAAGGQTAPSPLQNAATAAPVDQPAVAYDATHDPMADVVLLASPAPTATVVRPDGTAETMVSEVAAPALPPYDPATDPFAGVELLASRAPMTAAIAGGPVVEAAPLKPPYDPSSDPNSTVPLVAADLAPVAPAPSQPVVAQPTRPAEVRPVAQPSRAQLTRPTESNLAARPAEAAQAPTPAWQTTPVARPAVPLTAPGYNSPAPVAAQPAPALEVVHPTSKPATTTPQPQLPDHIGLPRFKTPPTPADAPQPVVLPEILAMPVPAETIRAQPGAIANDPITSGLPAVTPVVESEPVVARELPMTVETPIVTAPAPVAREVVTIAREASPVTADNEKTATVDVPKTSLQPASFSLPSLPVITEAASQSDELVAATPGFDTNDTATQVEPAGPEEPVTASEPAADEPFDPDLPIHFLDPSLEAVLERPVDAPAQAPASQAAEPVAEPEVEAKQVTQPAEASQPSEPVIAAKVDAPREAIAHEKAMTPVVSLPQSVQASPQITLPQPASNPVAPEPRPRGQSSEPFPESSSAPVAPVVTPQIATPPVPAKTSQAVTETRSTVASSQPATQPHTAEPVRDFRASRAAELEAAPVTTPTLPVSAAQTAFDTVAAGPQTPAPASQPQAPLAQAQPINQAPAERKIGQSQPKNAAEASPRQALPGNAAAVVQTSPIQTAPSSANSSAQPVVQQKPAPQPLLATKPMSEASVVDTKAKTQPNSEPQVKTQPNQQPSPPTPPAAVAKPAAAVAPLATKASEPVAPAREAGKQTTPPAEVPAAPRSERPASDNKPAPVSRPVAPRPVHVSQPTPAQPLNTPATVAPRQVVDPLVTMAQAEAAITSALNQPLIKLSPSHDRLPDPDEAADERKHESGPASEANAESGRHWVGSASPEGENNDEDTETEVVAEDQAHYASSGHHKVIEPLGSQASQRELLAREVADELAGRSTATTRASVSAAPLSKPVAAQPAQVVIKNAPEPAKSLPVASIKPAPVKPEAGVPGQAAKPVGAATSTTFTVQAASPVVAAAPPAASAAPASATQSAAVKPANVTSAKPQAAQPAAATVSTQASPAKPAAAPSRPAAAQTTPAQPQTTKSPAAAPVARPSGQLTAQPQVARPAASAPIPPAAADDVLLPPAESLTVRGAVTRQPDVGVQAQPAVAVNPPAATSATQPIAPPAASSQPPASVPPATVQSATPRPQAQSPVAARQPEAAVQPKPVAEPAHQPDVLTGRLIMPSGVKPPTTQTGPVEGTKRPLKLAKGEVFVDDKGNVTIGE